MARRFSADGGFGLLPDGAWTATRYACPTLARRLPDASVGKAEIRAMVSILMLSFFNFELIQCFLTIPLLKLFLCYNINRSRRRLTFISVEV